LRPPPTGELMEAPSPPDSEPALRKPSLLSQALPYLFTGAILIWVFTGLSSNVVDERHALTERRWIDLAGSGVKMETVEVRSEDGTQEYCGVLEGVPGVLEICPDGADFALRRHPDRDGVQVRRLERSRLPEGGGVSVNYVKRVKFSEIWAMVKEANLRLFLPVMVLHTLLFFFGDVLSFGMACRWFNAPGLRFREMMEMRGAPYVIQVGLAPLAEALFPLYLWRTKRVPVTETVSTNIWVFLLDLSAVLSVITPAVLYNLFVENLVPDIGRAWLAGCLIFWALFAGNVLFWKTPPGRRMTERFRGGRQAGPEARAGIRGAVGGAGRLLKTFGLARWHHMARCYLARAMLLSSTLLSNYVAIRALGMDPPLPIALIGIPLIVLSIFMPVGVGGYGGPQLLAWFFFVKVGRIGSPDQVIAYSMLWSTAFLAGRAAVGLLFIRGFWKRCFPAGAGP